MATEYQFTTESNWALFWSETYDADPVINVLERFHPIGTVTPGLTLSASHIAVWCFNDQAQGNWRYGARYFIKIGTGITVNGGTPDTVIKAGKIYLDQIEIIEIPQYASAFSIDIQIPYWHRNFQLKIWEYTGNDQNIVQDKLDQIIANTTA
ncbi:MAG: hypothetical protein QNJ33_18350 [Crocosphaera sp.]|nr:hypothetical protein [Crocosphaera sp.]